MTEQTKINHFMKGLKPVIKDNLVSIIDPPLTLMGWENIIIQVDTNLHQQDLKRKDESKGKSSNQKPTASTKSVHPTTSTPTILSSTPDVVPMEVDAVQTNRGKLTQEEHDH